MGYYDGNTVTAMWNYAQQYAMNDNSFNTTFRAFDPWRSQPDRRARYEWCHRCIKRRLRHCKRRKRRGTRFINDADSRGRHMLHHDRRSGRDDRKKYRWLLNSAGITWGFFEGGFDLTATNSNGSTFCSRTTTSSVTGVTKGWTTSRTTSLSSITRPRPIPATRGRPPSIRSAIQVMPPTTSTTRTTSLPQSRQATCPPSAS